MDYSRINEQLNTAEQAPTEPAVAKVTIVTLGGVRELDARPGMTVAEFKAYNGLEGQTLVDENSNVLVNSDIIRENMQVFVSTPKKNG